MIPKYHIPIELRAQMEDMRVDLKFDPARQAIERVSRQLEVAARQAFLDGKDFAIGPMKFEEPDPFDPRPIFEPRVFSIEVPAGAVERGWDPPQGWRVVQRPDFTDGEIARLCDGRLDWQEDRWQDHCGIVGCEECEKEPTVL